MIKSCFKWVAQILTNDEKETLALGNPTCWSYNFSWIECDFGALLLQSYAKIHSSFRCKVRITTEPLAEPCIPQTVDRDALPRCRTANNMSSFIKVWDGGQTPVVARYMMHPYESIWGIQSCKITPCRNWYNESAPVWMMIFSGSYFMLVKVMRWTHHLCYIAGVPDPAGLGKNQTVNNIRQQECFEMYLIKKNAMPSRFSFEDAGLIPSIAYPGPISKTISVLNLNSSYVRRAYPLHGFWMLYFHQSCIRATKSIDSTELLAGCLPFCFHTYWFVWVYAGLVNLKCIKPTYMLTTSVCASKKRLKV